MELNETKKIIDSTKKSISSHKEVKKDIVDFLKRHSDEAVEKGVSRFYPLIINIFKKTEGSARLFLECFVDMIDKRIAEREEILKKLN